MERLLDEINKYNDTHKFEFRSYDGYLFYDTGGCLLYKIMNCSECPYSKLSTLKCKNIVSYYVLNRRDYERSEYS
jgi:hypothetical protein